MPLITCPDCEKQISDAAPSCIHCGRPTEAGLQAQYAAERREVEDRIYPAREERSSNPDTLPRQKIGPVGWGLLGLAALMVVGAIMAERSESTAGSSGPARMPVDCITVSPEMTETIASGLTVGGGGTLRNAHAVKSSAHSSMYFISADIDGEGIEGDGPIGTWASNRLEPGQGLLMAVSPHATEFSQWPDGSHTKAETRMSDPGARESVDCVKQAGKR